MRSRFVLALAFILLLSPLPAEAVIIDLSELSIFEPKIIVNYTKPVWLFQTSLINKERPGEYELIQTPAVDDGSYVRSHEMIVDRPLVPGPYQLSLSATDQEGNPTSPDPLDVVTFEVLGIRVELVSPANGFSSTKPYNVILRTPESQTVCKWSFAGFFGFDTGMEQTEEGTVPSYDHTIAGLTNVKEDLYVICRDGNRETPAQFVIGHDASPPEVAVEVTPTILTDPREKFVSVKVTTDDPSVCTIQGNNFPGEDPENPLTFGEDREKIIFYNSINDELEHNFTYPVVCTNLAGLAGESHANVTVNFGLFKYLNVLEPPEITNQESFDLIVEPTFDAAFCTSNGDQMQDNGNGTFQLPYAVPGLGEGENMFDLYCEGGKNQSREYSVFIDTIPPAAPSVRPSNAICDGAIRASFNSTDQGSGIFAYRYTVLDGAGTLANGETISQQVELPLPREISGQLQWRVSAIDKAGNEGEQVSVLVDGLHRGQDEECGLPPFITLVKPSLGFALSSPYDVEIATLRESECRYALQSGIAWDSRAPFDTSDNVKHEETFSFLEQEIHVMCREDDGEDHFKKFTFGVDATSPRMAASAIPNPVVDYAQRVVVLEVTTDDRSYCTYNGARFGEDDVETDPEAYRTSHVTTLDFRHIDDPSPIDEEYSLECTNLARLKNRSTYTVQVYLGMPFDVEMISPSLFTAASDILFSVEPTKPSSCEWKVAQGNASYRNFTEVQGSVHSTSLGSLPEGTHQYRVRCMSSTELTEKLLSFTVDRSVPEISALSGKDAFCIGSTAMIHYNVTGVDQQLTLAIKLNGPAGVEMERNTTAAVITFPTEGMSAGRYELEATPRNRAGTTGTTRLIGLDIKDRTDPACTAEPGHCANGIKDADEVQVDCGGTCDACTACIDDLECPGTKVCEGGFCVPPEVLSCTSDAGCAAGEQCINGLCMEDLSCTSTAQCPDFSYDCVEGACVKLECTRDSECSGFDETCVNGACVPDGDPPPADDEGTDWLALAFIILGIVLMGGSGYFLYYQNEQKHARPYLPGGSSAPSQQPPSRSSKNPGPPAPSAPPAVPRSATPPQNPSAPETSTRSEEKEEARHRLFERFGGKDEPRPARKPTQRKSGEGYVDLSAVGARKDGVPKKKNKSVQRKERPKNEGEDEVFDDLDRIGK